MSDGLIKIADGFSMVAEGIRILNEMGINVDAGLAKVKPERADKTEKTFGKAKEGTAELKIEEIRAVLAEKSQSGKTKEIRDLLQQFGVAKLSAVAAEDYPELMKKAKVL
ncbi:hypothetical protein PM001_12025 [[Clostridium] symbiosum]|uniref:hypothetical protein n=1 Tax=Clostridium symbiosum TaxID=1512 RepID=UPI0006C7BC53|nr:hypothetical protein [[Clostridium] symbiosum]MDB2036810.1 hypothetical protein [[Clostridium] symbiosum]